MGATSWNLMYAVPGGLSRRIGTEPASHPVPDYRPSGWTGSDGPAIPWENWPRSTGTGLPMMHVLTLWLPSDYQRQGPQYPAIAFFAGDGQFSPGDDDFPAPDPESSQAWVRDLAAAVEHPMLRRRESIINDQYALIWLTEAEIAPGPRAPHPDLRENGQPSDTTEGLNAWDNRSPRRDIWLVPREDPNAGKVPVEYPEDGDDYESVTDDNFEWKPWADKLNGYDHLGGSSFHIQGLPDGLTPWYMELQEQGFLNFGTGNAQLDLESDTFDWACD